MKREEGWLRVLIKLTKKRFGRSSSPTFTMPGLSLKLVLRSSGVQQKNAKNQKRSIKGAKLNVLRKFFFLHINRIKSKRQNSITMSTKKFSHIWGFGKTFPYVSMETERVVTYLWKIVFAHVLYQSFHRLNFVVSPTR